MYTMLRTEEINCCQNHYYYHHHQRREAPTLWNKQGGTILIPRCGKAKPAKVEKVLAERQFLPV